MEACKTCLKPEDLCVCAQVGPIPTQRHVLVLQHPQEPDKELGTARLAHLALPNSTLRVGLSWPNLKTALGREQVDPSKWIVLYLGTKTGAQPSSRVLELVDKKGLPVASPDPILRAAEGLIVLDGTWSQAKTMWWRNAWLLKTRRAVLNPPRRSLYGRLRREPRRESVATIEAIALALTALGEPPEVEEKLLGAFSCLLERYGERGKR